MLDAFEGKTKPKLRCLVNVCNIFDMALALESYLICDVLVVVKDYSVFGQLEVLLRQSTFSKFLHHRKMFCSPHVPIIVLGDSTALIMAFCMELGLCPLLTSVRDVVFMSLFCTLRLSNPLRFDDHDLMIFL